MMELPFELWDNCDLSTDRASYNALVHLMNDQHLQLTSISSSPRRWQNEFTTFASTELT